MSFLLHAVFFYLVLPALIVALICLGADWLITRRPAGEILRGWWHSATARIYALRARGDADVIDGIPVPAPSAPPPAAPLPPPPAFQDDGISTATRRIAGAPGPVPAAPPAGPASGGGVPGMAQSDLMYFIGALVAEASNGDIKDVRRVVATLAAAMDEMTGGVSALGRRLSEPDKDYGPEIWEPLQTAAAQVMAASLHCGDSDAQLQALLSATVSELADSPQHAPHASQLNGGNG